jgi:hypothetical protein
MSGESAQHIRLVERLVATVDARHRTGRGIMVFADHRSFGVNQPPMIGGYKPDVFAQDVPETFRVIGEAKTPNDFKDDRSMRQISAFLDHLALYPNTSFYLAVPWFLKETASNVVRGLKNGSHDAVYINVLPFT